MNANSILLIVDDPADVELISQQISQHTHNIEFKTVSDLDEFLGCLAQNKLAAIITDYKLSWSNGIKILQFTREGQPDCPVIFFSSSDRVDIGVRAIKLGAYDYITNKSTNLNRLGIVVKKAISHTAPISTILSTDAKYRRWFQESTQGCFTLDHHGMIQDINRAALTLLGIPGDVNPRKLNFFEYLSDLSQDARLLKHLDEPDRDTTFELKLHTGNSPLTWIEMNIQGVKNHRGEIIEYDGSFQNITPRKLMEEELRDSEHRFRRFASTVNDVIYRYDPATNQYDFISPSFERLTGYTMEELYADPRNMLRTVAHEEDRDYVFNIARDALELGDVPFTREYRIIRKDGTEIWVRDRMNFEFDEDGDVYRVNGVIEDITEKKRAGMALQREMQFSENILETASALIAILDSDARVVRFNTFAEKLTGYQREELKNADWFETFIEKPVSEKARAKYDKMLASSYEYWSFENVIRTRNGELLTVAWQNSKLMDEEGGLVGVLCIGIDVTPYRQAEKAKDDLQKQLYQAQKMEAIGILTGGLAHDFNNLMTSILGHTDMAMVGMTASAQVRNDLEKIRLLTIKAADLVRKLLLFSRNQPMQMKVMNVTRVLEPMMEMLGRVIGEQIEIRSEFDEKLWEIEADPGNLEQIFMNLAVNAKDAMPGGGVFTIRTENLRLDDTQVKSLPHARRGDYVKITVSDTGVGMEESVVNHIFEPFYTTKGVGEGSGLGLSVVYGIVKQHGGWINVFSDKGRGTRIEILLPRADVPAQKKKEKSTKIGKTFTHGEKILLIEDEDDLRRIAAVALRKHGFRVISAGNGTEAWNAFIQEAGDFDVVFSDIVLPDCLGMDLVKQMQEIKPSFKVLLTSGYPSYRSNELTEKKISYSILPKPYTVDVLVRELRNCLKK